MRSDHDLGKRIAISGNLEALGQVARARAQELGFEHFFYGFRKLGEDGTPIQAMLCGYPREWVARYDEQGWLLTDPVLSHALHSVIPFTWDDLPRPTASVSRMFEEAADHGLAHGLTVPLHGFESEFGVMSLARPHALPRGHGRVRLTQRAQWLASCLQSRMRVLLPLSAYQTAVTESSPAGPVLRSGPAHAAERLLLI